MAHTENQKGVIKYTITGRSRFEISMIRRIQALSVRSALMVHKQDIDQAHGELL